MAVDELAKKMRSEWDRRIAHDYRYWMSDGVESDERMWATGERDLSLLLAELPNDPSAFTNALELGCGVGRLSRAASTRFKHLFALDVSAEGIARAKELNRSQANIEFVLGNGTDLSSIDSSSIDCAYSFAVIGSLPVAVFARYLREIGRVLRPGGMACLQLYFGQQQNLVADDTISLRSYDRGRFTAAAHFCGLTVRTVRDLILDFEVSDSARGVNAVLVTLERSGEVTVSAADVLSMLVAQEEQNAPEKWPGSLTEYYMAVACATKHLDAGRCREAVEALNFARKHFAQVEPEVLETLRAVERRLADTASVQTQSEDALSAKVELTEHRGVITSSESGHLELKTAPEGNNPVIYSSGLPLDNPEKPAASAKAWAQRTLNDPAAARASEWVVAGFAGGYHIEALQALTNKPIHVVEFDPAVVSLSSKRPGAAAVASRLRSLYASVDEFQRALEDGTIAADAYLIVHPQTKALWGRHIEEVRRSLLSRHGFDSLRPSIAVVGPLYGGSLPIAQYVTRALAAMGQRVNYIDLSPFFKPYTHIGSYFKDSKRLNGLQGNFVDFLSKLVLDALTEKPADIVICLAQAPLSGQVLDELRRRGTVTAMWFVEDCRRFTTWKDISRYYDYMFLIQSDGFPALVEAAGAGRAIYLPVGCDPDVHCPLSLDNDERARWGSAISFVGAGYNNRQQMFATLARRDFKIWGTEWALCPPFDKLVQEKGRRLDPTEYVKIFNASQINLNLHSSSERDGVEPDGDFVNPRTFELASCGVFQLVDERVLLPTLFSPGKEVATFHDKASLESALDYYLEHPEERQRIAAAGRARALSEHTYVHRMRTMLSYIYADKYTQLAERARNNPWEVTLKTAAEFPELKERFDKVFERGEEPTLEALVFDIQLGKGALTETEQKILFMHQLVKQIAYVEEQRQGQ